MRNPIPYYENVEFALADSTTDYDLDVNESDFLTDFGPTNVVGSYPSWVEIRTDQTITVKLNLATNDSITITSTDSPMTINGTEIINMFLTNSSGSVANVKLRFQQSPNLL